MIYKIKYITIDEGDAMQIPAPAPPGGGDGGD